MLETMDQDPPELQKAVAAISKGEFDRSFEIVSRLAQQGAAVAQHFLGWHYHKGIGTEQDDRRAVIWWQKAAQQGVPEAQQGLGWAYANGRGVEEDPAEAYRWYNRAIAGGDEEAREGLAEIARRLSAEQLLALENEDSS
ncbi:tetratricopeptide repeat protein [Thiogranum longum]